MGHTERPINNIGSTAGFLESSHRTPGAATPSIGRGNARADRRLFGHLGDRNVVSVPTLSL
jgi:hypothetical protein